MGKRRNSPFRTLLLLAIPLFAAVAGALFFVFAVDPGLEDERPATDLPAEVATEETGPAAEGANATEDTSAKTPKVDPATAASVRGVVRLYRTKEPVVGLELRLKPAEGSGWKAVTGKDGSFRFARVASGPGFELHGHRDPYAAIALSLDLAPKDDVDVGTLWMDVPVDLDVIVLTLAGAPVEGATVSAFAAGRTAAGGDETVAGSERDRRILSLTAPERPATQGTTKADGTVRLTGLMPGTYRISARADGLALASRTGIVLAPDASRPAVRLLLGRGHSLTGHVLDPEEKPVEGATVIAVGGNGWRPSADKWMVQSDAEGVYQFDDLAAGLVTLFLAREGKPPLQVGTVGIPSTPRFDIRLRPGGTIRGTITSEDGAPVEGAEVRTAIQNTWSPMSAVTDAEGKYVLEDVPAGQLAYFTVRADGFMPHPDPTAPQQTSGQSLREGAEMIQDVVLRKGLTALVTVLSDTKAPLVDAEVSLFLSKVSNQPFVGRTDQSGVAAIRGLMPGTYLAVIRAEGFVQDTLPRWHRQLLGKGTEALPAEWRLVVEAAEGETRATFQLSRGATVSGKVLDADGSVVAGAKVAVTNSQSEFPVFTDGDGLFTVAAVAPSGRATASATVPDRPGGKSEPFIVAEGATVEDIEIKLAKGATIRGVVRNQTGEPLTDAFVRFVPGKLSGSWAFQRFNGREQFPVDAEGRFEITGVEAIEGEFVTVRADAAGLLPAWKNDVKVTAGQETGGVELILATGLTISGRVESQTGEKVVGATVTASYRRSKRGSGFVPGLGGNPTAQTDENGQFVLNGLGEGKYRVWAQAPEFAYGSRVESAAGSDDVLITLKPGLVIAGVVKDTEGEPVAGMPVSARKTDGNQSGWWWWGGTQAYTGPDGTFELRDMAEGVYTLTVSARWQWGRDVNVKDTTLEGVRAGRDDIEMTVESGGIIEGTITDTKGVPVPTGWVYARFESSGNRRSWQDNRYGQMGEGGSFRIVGLKPGPYTVTASGSFRNASQKGVAAGTRNVQIQVEPSFSIEGRVVDGDGIGIGKRVDIRIRRPGTDDWNWVDDFTPGEGVFMALGLQEGAWDLQVRASGIPPIVVPNVTAGTRGLIVTAKEGVSMKGMVADASGSPVPKAWLQATQLGVPAGAVPSSRSTRCDQNGQFELKGLATGEYRVTVRANQFAIGVFEPIQGNDTNAKFVMDRGGTASGKLVDGAGEPMAKVSLQLENDNGVTIAQTTTNSQGAFTLPLIPSTGSYKVRLGKWIDGSWTRHTPKTRLSAGQTDVTLKWE